MIRIGTRRSPLALWQAHHVEQKLKEKRYEVTLVPIVTEGDKKLSQPLVEIGGKGLFLKEIEEALLDNRVDLAVHSLKDVPAFLPAGLILAGFVGREDPRDAWVSRDGTPFADLPPGARVGTGSLRRAIQLLRKKPDLAIVPLRGNVGTRLKKIETENLHGVILAAAGLKRLGLEEKITEIFSPQEVIPAVGQGILGLEIREGDTKVYEAVQAIATPGMGKIVSAERTWLSLLEGGCRIPMGAYCWEEEKAYAMVSFLASPDNRYFVTATGKDESPENLGNKLAMEILQQGGKEILTYGEHCPHPFTR